MKLVLPGGSGQIGHLVARTFAANGHEVVVLTRAPNRYRGPGRAVAWDGTTLGPWAQEIDGADAVLNLAGRSVDCRYTPANRRAIVESRLQSTRAVGNAIRQAERPPPVWLQMSTATLYAHRYDAPNDEATGHIGGDEPGAPDTWRFSIDVARRWERAARESAESLPDTRLVLLRSAMVMAPDRGGVFDVLLGLVRRGLGGASGDGRQYVSWIHGRDFVRALTFLLAHDEIDGPVNLASPHPLPNRAFMQALREAWGVPVGLPAFRWMVEIGAWALRTESELVLKSRRVVPGRLQDAGFRFAFPRWPDAARDLVRQWRRFGP